MRVLRSEDPLECVWTMYRYLVSDSALRLFLLTGLSRWRELTVLTEFFGCQCMGSHALQARHNTELPSISWHGVRHADTRQHNRKYTLHPADASNQSLPECQCGILMCAVH